MGPCQWSVRSANERRNSLLQCPPARPDADSQGQIYSNHCSSSCASSILILFYVRDLVIYCANFELHRGVFTCWYVVCLHERLLVCLYISMFEILFIYFFKDIKIRELKSTTLGEALNEVGNGLVTREFFITQVGNEVAKGGLGTAGSCCMRYI